ncbi:MAG TPA: hypothetical protein VK791_04035 [bacterium]|jgi:hypothetical protein|nr:hypothetical protein [bacterium]
MKIILSLIFILLTSGSVWADESAVNTPVPTAVEHRYDLGLRAQIYWVMIQMTFDSKNKWVYEKELSDCYALLGDADKAQEELKASVTDNPNGVVAPAATVAKIRRHRNKVIQAQKISQTIQPTSSVTVKVTLTPVVKATLTPTDTPTDEPTATPTDEAAAAPTADASSASTDATPTPAATPAKIGTLTLGSYLGLWSVNYALPTNGTEIMFPMSASVNVSSDVVITGSTNYLMGFYQYLGGDTLSLGNFSDSSLSAQFGFKTMDLDTVVSETFNIPTGNPSWSAQSASADLPTALVDPRYSAAGFSFSTVYGISVPVDAAKCSLGVGYVFNTDYNSNAGLPLTAVDVLPGNSLFFNLNRVSPTGDGQSDTFQTSVYFSFVTTENSVAFTCPGPNINFSYAWNNPSAFSFELGSQFYLPGQTAVDGVLQPDPTYSSGPRLYLKPSYVIDDLTLAGQVKYLLPNGYDPSSLSYVQGGLLLSLGPSYNLKIDNQAFLTLTAAYNYIDNIGGGFDANGNRIDVLYNWFTCSASHSFTF